MPKTAQLATAVANPQLAYEEIFARSAWFSKILLWGMSEKGIGSHFWNDARDGLARPKQGLMHARAVVPCSRRDEDGFACPVRPSWDHMPKAGSHVRDRVPLEGMRELRRGGSAVPK